MKRLGILLSGRGSNFEAIAENIARGKLDAEIASVISNRAEARGIEIARERGLPAVALASKGVEREEYDRRLVAELQERGVELVCLAGFMRLLTAEFCRAFPLRALNIHPSLLPAFPGLDAQKQALEHGVRISGCTVHFVDEQSGRRPDYFAGCRAGAGGRHRGGAGGADPGGRASDLQRSDRDYSVGTLAY